MSHSWTTEAMFTGPPTQTIRDAAIALRDKHLAAQGLIPSAEDNTLFDALFTELGEFLTVLDPQGTGMVWGRVKVVGSDVGYPNLILELTLTLNQAQLSDPLAGRHQWETHVVGDLQAVEEEKALDIIEALLALEGRVPSAEDFLVFSTTMDRLRDLMLVVDPSSTGTVQTTINAGVTVGNLDSLNLHTTLSVVQPGAVPDFPTEPEVDAKIATHAATPHGGSHPDLATHNTLGLATQQELDDHALTPHGGGGGFVHSLLAANATNNSNVTYVNLFTFPLLADSTYTFEAFLFYFAAATATGLTVAVDAPVGATIDYGLIVPESLTAAKGLAAEASGAALTGAGSGGATAVHARLAGLVVSTAVAGNLVIKFRSEVNGSLVTVRAGSFSRLLKV